ncbi:sigma-70 family RNA polymerase sigma factor [Acidaminococcus sp. NSJ-142]|uniref:RNA polymerase sigma factor n=1 Tax=Acidaminococcus hominis TaxID=2897706 RepID=UPI001E5BE5ED|nr:sigma-70 family RNA polymerase sigma factor [Acidaminococcus hominis]MCD2436584.1 sigma-70 family RNA polymerase sigma factor [Acidaminococcus hominis]
MASLIAQVKLGSTSAQQILLNQFMPVLNRTAQQEMDPEERQDLLSDLQLALIQATQEYPGPDCESYPGYIKKLACFVLMHHQRARRKWKEAEERAACTLDSVYYASYDNHPAQEEMLRQALNALTDEEWLIIKRIILEERTLEDISRELGKSTSTIWNQKERALTKMRWAALVKEMRPEQ